MKQWNITDLGNILRFSHPRGVFYLDFGHSLNFSPGQPPDETLTRRAEQVMADTEKGVRVNTGEDRMAGHYWLRSPSLAPEEKITAAITAGMRQCRDFSARVHQGVVANESGAPFRHLAVIGIGGSQLGFQFIAKALGQDGYKLTPYALDNTDPESVDSLLKAVGSGHLDELLFVVASKSGGTAEIRNSYRVLEQIYQAAGLNFARHATAVTMAGSALDRYARDKAWLEVFPVWDWVGGRFSVLSPVGVLPLALLGLDTETLLAGAAAADELTRPGAYPINPALLLTRYFLRQTREAGKHNLVVLPYKDRLDLWGRYLQQLFMESLGKTVESAGGPRQEGLSIFGNKGTTDQHSYVQQLLAGHNDFFAILFSVLGQGAGAGDYGADDEGVGMGDYLLAFCHATLGAMQAHQRESLLISLDRLDAFTVGALIAIFERLVGYYAACIGLNPYDQPQVEFGKKSATAIIGTKKRLSRWLAALSPAAAGAALPAGEAQTPALGAADLSALKQSFEPGEYRILFYLLQQMFCSGRLRVCPEDLDLLLR